MTLWVRGCKEGLGSYGVPSHIPPLELPAPPVKKHVRGWRGRGQASLHDVWVWRQRPLCGSDEGREGPCWSWQRPAPPGAGSGERNPTPATPPLLALQATSVRHCCHLAVTRGQTRACATSREWASRNTHWKSLEPNPGPQAGPALFTCPLAPLKGSSPGPGDRRKVTVAGTEAVLMAASTRDSRGP